jgi:hypothetical protein
MGSGGGAPASAPCAGFTERIAKKIPTTSPVARTIRVMSGGLLPYPAPESSPIAAAKLVLEFLKASG